MKNLLKTITSLSLVILLLIFITSVSACSSVKDDYSYEYSDDYEEFIDEYPDGRHTIRFEDEDDNNWRIRINDGKIVSVHKNGDRLSDEDLDEARSFIERRIKKTHGEIGKSRRYYANANSNFHFDSKEFQEGMEELKEELNNIGIRTKHHINEENLHAAMRELKRNLGNIRVKINDENVRLNIDDDFDFDFDFDDDIEIDIDLGDFGERMGKFGRAMGDLGEDLKDYRVDMDEFEDHMEDFGEKMDELGFDMHELKIEMKKLKRFLIEIKEELLDDGYIDDIDDSVTLEFEDDELYIDGEKVDDDVRRKYESIHEKYYDEKPDNNWRLEL